MKKRLLIEFVVLLSCLIFILFYIASDISSVSISAEKLIRNTKIDTSTTVLASEPKPSIINSIPSLLSIPKINLSANVVAVGLTKQSAMGVPDNFVEVGWYDLGYKLGQKGSVVLDGHYDNFHGEPAVFYNLDNLSKGDKIFVTDQLGKTYTYVVTKNIVYPYDHMPLSQIFAANDKNRLNIITCHGVWDSNFQTYNQRTVIYSQLRV